MEQKYLSQLMPGERGFVTEYLLEDDMTNRLRDMGLIAGSCVECVCRSPLGDPKAYLVKGALLALRSTDTAGILVSCGHGRQSWD